VRAVGQIDVGGVHSALAQQPSRRTQRVALDDQIALPGDNLLSDARP
jgi:hypothetical protein